MKKIEVLIYSDKQFYEEQGTLEFFEMSRIVSRYDGEQFSDRIDEIDLCKYQEKYLDLRVVFHGEVQESLIEEDIENCSYEEFWSYCYSVELEE